MPNGAPAAAAAGSTTDGLTEAAQRISSGAHAGALPRGGRGGGAPATPLHGSNAGSAAAPAAAPALHQGAAVALRVSGVAAMPAMQRTAAAAEPGERASGQPPFLTPPAAQSSAAAAIALPPWLVPPLPASLAPARAPTHAPSPPLSPAAQPRGAAPALAAAAFPPWAAVSSLPSQGGGRDAPHNGAHPMPAFLQRLTSGGGGDSAPSARSVLAAAVPPQPAPAAVPAPAQAAQMAAMRAEYEHTEREMARLQAERAQLLALAAEEGGGGVQCSICLDAHGRQNTAALIPCGHTFCADCAAQLERQRARAVPGADLCPRCRTLFTHAQRVYV